MLFPRLDAHQAPLAAVVLVSGGVVGGNRLDLWVAASAEAKEVAVGQAGKSTSRSSGPNGKVDVSLQVVASGWLKWPTLKTILFDGIRLDHQIRIEMGGTGKVLAGELLVFDQRLHGEAKRRGFLRDRWLDCRCRRLVFTTYLSG